MANPPDEPFVIDVTELWTPQSKHAHLVSGRTDHEFDACRIAAPDGHFGGIRKEVPVDHRQEGKGDLSRRRQARLDCADSRH
jgi:hypothetical protein